MSFTALHPELGRIDATLIDLGQGLEWEGIYRTRPRIRLTCPECGHGVHAKLSPRRRTRYFAHDPGRSPHCHLSVESADHHLLKRVLAEAIRRAGWSAELELPAPDGSWRADVMAISADGEQMAWEAQLSPITDGDIQMRTNRYYDDDIDVCWVSSRDRVPWLCTVPAIAVAPADPPTAAERWMVHDGLTRFDYKCGSWIQVDDVTLPTFVRWVLDRSLTIHPIGRRYRRIRLPGSNAIIRRSVSWSTQRSIDAEAKHEAMRQRQEAAKAAREKRAREAEEHRKQVERERQRQEDERRRVESEKRHREFMIESKRRQAAWEAQRREQERKRQEQERQEELARRERDHREQTAAQQWWEGVSAAQLAELMGHVTALSISEHASRALPRSDEREREYAYGLALYTGRRLFGVVMPCPHSLDRLPNSTRIFVRNAREKACITATGLVNADLVTHFDLPDHEQTSLL
ncbi:competence protein CoiA family protein [Actinomadura syzygii]|uniref:Competence CoiA family protein n=1 Tax=Actinomadura syzygii TaxID=1427538 RepID=A0A5D0UAN8_9ACTN|nr:competence protein CoiA family protein [Actinomadura syzygii]TYC14683.1 competence CoiA family protein [Actinomadura syzygii]